MVSGRPEKQAFQENGENESIPKACSHVTSLISGDPERVCRACLTQFLPARFAS